MKKNICTINFTRENGNQLLNIKVTPELEKLFKTDETETSEVYLNSEGNGLVFYKLSDKLAKYIAKFNEGGYDRNEQTVINHYGTNLYDEGARLNASVLRTVDISEDEGISVVVNDLIVDTEVQRWIQGLAKFIKFLHTNFVEKTEVKATINLEF